MKHTMKINAKESLQSKAKGELTKKIDHILYTEWDPIGVHDLKDFDCSNEYHSYLPTIVEMVYAGESVQSIANQLLAFEENIWDDNRGVRRCQVIAAMVSRYGPHAEKTAFTPVVNTENTQCAYQSVLNLLTQTRIDEYEGTWDKVSETYEEIIKICEDHLPESLSLRAACLNNLGRSYGYAGQFEKALECFSDALAMFEVAPGYSNSEKLICMANAVNCREHLGQFSETKSYLQQMSRICALQDGEEGEQTIRINERLNQVADTNRIKPAVKLQRTKVENDGCGTINGMALI